MNNTTSTNNTKSIDPQSMWNDPQWISTIPPIKKIGYAGFSSTNVYPLTIQRIYDSPDKYQDIFWVDEGATILGLYTDTETNHIKNFIFTLSPHKEYNISGLHPNQKDLFNSIMIINYHDYNGAPGKLKLLINLIDKNNYYLESVGPNSLYILDNK